MAAVRPLVTVQPLEGHMATNALAGVPRPDVLKAPMRPDVVRFVHASLSRNSRQPCAVSKHAGHQTSAESCGVPAAPSPVSPASPAAEHTAPARVPSATCAAAAVCSPPTKTWRRWHRHVNVNIRRYATASALAASAVPSLVLARGHRIESVPEFLLVVSDTAEGVEKTASAIKILKQVGAVPDAEKARDSQGIRPGMRKMRNRGYIFRMGPLIVYGNIPMSSALNLVELASGDHIDRLVILTYHPYTLKLYGENPKLNSMFGTFDKSSEKKKGYVLLRSKMHNADLSMIINSDEVQLVVQPIKKDVKRHTLKRNPLKNLYTLLKLNPYLDKKRTQLPKEEAAAIKAAGPARYKTMISDSECLVFSIRYVFIESTSDDHRMQVEPTESQCPVHVRRITLTTA
ncbi:unnamed protein product [Musa acuminata subsp. malaccensis]|uniref:(wild Malaysian banana) hypothetical protein n=1 Tax=Musa acuminata subsp. malaccensis TaxID=214687 RepID=A0A8D7BC34_MUSAM|nr:unnamed protein product [Musa acuminata subsp. malaccensis]